MASKVTTRLALLLAPLVLAGCTDSMMKTIGLQRDPPDEFQVTTQPALAMPPDLNVAAAALPRPDPGASRPQEVAVRQQAEDAMIGGAAIGGRPHDRRRHRAGPKRRVRPPRPIFGRKSMHRG